MELGAFGEAEMGRPVRQVEVDAEQRAWLEQVVRRGKSEARLKLRAQIVLLAAEQVPSKAIAARVGASLETVCKWRRRFSERGIEGLYDEPRSGAPRKISDEKVEEVVVRTLEETPPDATHWSTRDLAKKVGISHASVHRIWRAFSLKPHREESFSLSNDPFLIEKVRDIVGLYMNPPDNACVLCIDEKSQIQALNRKQPLLTMRPGQAARRSRDYERNGTTTLYAALEVASGRVIGRCKNRQRATEFLSFLRDVEREVPSQMDIHVVCDNASSHKTEKVKNWFARRANWHLHFTATRASWLNLVERWFGLLTQKKIKRGSHRSVKQLVADIQSFIDATNNEPKPFKWVRTADEILASIARFSHQTLTAHAKQNQETSDTGH